MSILAHDLAADLSCALDDMRANYPKVAHDPAKDQQSSPPYTLTPRIAAALLRQMLGKYGNAARVDVRVRLSNSHARLVPHAGLVTVSFHDAATGAELRSVEEILDALQGPALEPCIGRQW